MSKRGYISRYLLILKRLKQKPYSTFEEINGYIEDQFEYLLMSDDTLNSSFSKRTFQRDLREIRNVFGINIEYSRSNKGYYIEQSETENLNFQRMLEAFDMFNSLNVANDLNPFIQMENRKPQGTENLYGLIHAIKNKFIIQFNYQKFWEDKISKRRLAPYLLKEFKNRWFLIGRDEGDGKIKSFGLDRLTSLEITNVRFKSISEFDVDRYFKYSFGIISSENLEPLDVILSFNSFQGKYIKTLPIHHSQKILLDNEKELRISLKLCVTHDFVMELLSYGSNVKVLEPTTLISELSRSYSESLSLYKHY